jgi:hypothetical protein
LGVASKSGWGNFDQLNVEVIDFARIIFERAIFKAKAVTKLPHSWDGLNYGSLVRINANTTQAIFNKSLRQSDKKRVRNS